MNGKRRKEKKWARGGGERADIFLGGNGADDGKAPVPGDGNLAADRRGAISDKTWCGLANCDPWAL